jgi:hypothetical protein
MTTRYRVLADETCALLCLGGPPLVVRTQEELGRALRALVHSLPLDAREACADELHRAYDRHLEMVADRLLATFAPADTEAA